jgi:hypothetical protein
MHNALDFDQILYFAGWVCIINEKNMFHSFFRLGNHMSTIFGVYYSPSLNLNDTVFTCPVYEFHFIASKYVRQVFMRTPKKWQNSQPVDGGH